KNPSPNDIRMGEIAKMLDLNRDMVRMWFYNRNRKERLLEEKRRRETYKDTSYFDEKKSNETVEVEKKGRPSINIKR
ncbi:hypothetical protein PENTCL1PPCAC_12968, partial [Pristionchus entomophagus]